MAPAIRWSPRAARQFESICTRIAADSERYARVFAQKIMQVIRGIPANPRAGRIVPEYSNPCLRERIHGNYRIVYRLREDIVEIVAICHGARRVANALDESDEL